MSIIVQKYGGTSVGSIERMRHVADLVIAERNAGHQVVVVASAMAGATNHLVSSAQQFNNVVGTPAYDFLISTGENVSCGLLALALSEKGVKAIPMAGWQVPIRTNELHSKARIVDIDTLYLHQLLQAGIVPVITGFQGIGPDQQLTTLGRGGSDTSAVAIASALKAKRCDIYTDIDGIYTADPRVVADAQFISDVTYTAAFHMASLGTKIIHPRAVECSMQANMPLRILSSFGSDKFTTLVNQPNMHHMGISHMMHNILYTIPVNDIGRVTDVLHNINALDIPLDMVTQSDSCLQFCAENSDDSLVKDVLNSFGMVELSAVPCAKVSVVGAVSDQQFNSAIQILEAQKVCIIYSCMDGMRFSILLSKDQMELAINALHTFFFKTRSKKVDFQSEIQ